MFQKINSLDKKQKILLVSILVLILSGAVLVVLLFAKPEKKETAKKEKDPLEVVLEGRDEESAAEVDISKVIDDKWTDEVTYGIDVSYHQGQIDWKRVAESGVDFAMIRVGYRTLESGVIVEDEQAKYNLQEAHKYGIKVGVYFFSTAISEKEAIEEANWTADFSAKYPVTYPVAYDCEGFKNSENRQYGMNIAERTDVAMAFLGRIVERGYTPLFYGSKSDMEDEIQWDMERLSSLYSIWVAEYPTLPYPETTESTYASEHVMWQYTCRGSVPGIQGSVDMNVAYFGYEDVEGPQDESGTEHVEENVEAGMKFTAVNERVTAKDETNLRDRPSQGHDSKVMYTLLNGQTATRTGISSSGWSRVVYNGNTYYAVSGYLTTDLSYKPPQEEPDDGINTEFETVNQQVTAKEVVNLRQKPSVNDEIAPVVAQIQNGDVVTRTGINTDVGWSRVVYQGQTLYCVSSYLESVSD